MISDIAHCTFTNLGCKIHYWHRKGRGDRYIIFFHGACVDHRMFEEQIDIFDDSYDLVFWDARGHGLSKLKNGARFSFADMVSDCQKLYEVLGIKKAILIGQSMGGNLVQVIAYQHPKSVEKLILIGCTDNFGKLKVAEKITLKFTKFIFSCYPWKLLIRQSARACGNKEHVRQYAEDCFKRLNKSEIIDIITAVTGCLHEDVGFRFKHPVLLLCGTDDRSGNIKKSMKFRAQTDPVCTLHMIKNAGHNANQDEPEIINNHISQFIVGR